MRCSGVPPDCCRGPGWASRTAGTTRTGTGEQRNFATIAGAPRSAIAICKACRLGLRLRARAKYMPFSLAALAGPRDARAADEAAALPAFDEVFYDSAVRPSTAPLRSGSPAALAARRRPGAGLCAMRSDLVLERPERPPRFPGDAREVQRNDTSSPPLAKRIPGPPKRPPRGRPP